jgi:sugar phosphate isomerase/epimerase
VRIGVLTVVYRDLPLEETLDRLAALGVEAVELGTGGYPGDGHCEPDALLRDPDAARRLRRAVQARSMKISALSCHGNPLHPRDDIAHSAHLAFTKTVQLAEVLEVPVVNTFSGCPGDREGGRVPNWITCAWPPEYTEALAWQWEEKAVPYWHEQCALARKHGVRIALELHPGFLVYNPETLLRLRAATGPELGANFDPSHLFWQGIDPVAAIRLLGADNAIFHVHAKDTYLDRDNIRTNGVLDTKRYGQVQDRAWTFRTVGFGHSESTWREIVSALRVAGYDDVISIEHEDLLLSRDEGLGRAVELLRTVVPGALPTEPWWT